MNQKTSQGMGDIFAGLFLKVFWILVAVGILYSCIDNNTRWLKPDYTKPHEYLNVTGYGQNGETLDGNDNTFSGIGLRDYKNNFFEVGKGECTEYLNRIPEEKVRLSMGGFNVFLDGQDDLNDERVAYAKLQCIEFQGWDKACEDQMMHASNQAKDSKTAMLIIVESMTKCRKEKNIGDYRVISLVQ